MMRHCLEAYAWSDRKQERSCAIDAAQLRLIIDHDIDRSRMIPWLTAQQAFPPVELALREPNGLLAAGADLSPQRLLQAYRLGIFPWFGPEQPILWWSPDPRMVLFPRELHVSRSLQKRMRRQDYTVSCDTAFRAVVEACASTPRPGQDGTWITPQMMEAYCELHAQGYGRSVEVRMDGQLVGGIYGVAVGNVFFAESMFHHATDASKIALVHLVRELEQQGCALIDCQMKTEHLASLGAREINRAEFLQQLERLIEQ